MNRKDDTEPRTIIRRGGWCAKFDEVEPEPEPPLCDLCREGIPHMCPHTGELRVFLYGQRL